MPMVTINSTFNFLLNHKLDILGQESGSHILYAICYSSIIPVSIVTINGILNILLNHKYNILGKKMEATFCMLYVTATEYLCKWLLYILNILGPENESQILYTICYNSRMPVSMVTVNTEHIRSRKWKPNFVHYMLL